ncbi:sensor histidine kinase [Amycolatopsis sp. NPDC021455]|uniref:sensor histidine kinase n=1 Tax=Amycolatopsis sp. NPDC021455 TaxID=3154901 RepID=UPI0033EF0C37
MSRDYRDLQALIRSPTGELAVLGAVAVVVFAGNLLVANADVAGRPLWPGGVGLMAIAVAALVWRRKQPLLALGLTAAAAVVYYLLDYPAGFEPLPFIVALYGASSQGYRILSFAAAVLAAGMVGLVQLLTEPRVGPTGLLVVLGWLIVVIVVAEVIRSRRAYILEVEQRAIEAERSRESEAVRRVVEERLRIARELHDALAHHISVISVQAGAAMLRKDSKPELAHEVLPTIKQSAADAMRELRATLGVLRHPDEDHAVSDAVPLAPPPSLDRLDGLVRSIEAAGPKVVTEIRGDRRPLPTDVDLAAYRIVQEALTNITRHAEAGTAKVVLGYGEEQLELWVDDDGLGVAESPPAGGNGLLGMRERAAAIGGTLRAGPRTEGGFGVYANLPLGKAG